MNMDDKVFRIKLGEVFKTTSGGTPSRKNPSYYGGSIPWVKSGELESNVILDTEEKISEEALKNSSAKIFPKGTLLIALYGATIGKLAKLGIDAATNQAVCGIFENEEQDLQYLYWFLRLKRRDLINAGIGGAQPNISQTILKNLDVPLPSKPIQQAIVSKIEELFSEIDKGIEQLKTARQQLKTYRQAVLNKLVSEKNLKTIESVIAKLDQGWSPKCENEASTNVEEWAVIKTSAVQHGSFVDYENKRLPKELKAREQHELIEGDILITRAGPRVRVGVCCLVKYVRPKLLNCDKVYRIKVNKSLIEAEYLVCILNTPKYLREIERMKTGINDSGVNLTQKGFLSIQIPVPSIEEQLSIVQEIESRFSVADKMEESISQSLQQAEVLRQSILKKAFEGKLVQTETEPVLKVLAKEIPFKRKVLAGKIIHLLHNTPHFGLIKFQKVFYITENFIESEEENYETGYLQGAAGPYDRGFTLAFRKEMREMDWFNEETVRGGGTRFVPGKNVGFLISEYPKYFRSKGKEIVFVLELLRDTNTHEAELIATLYAVWNNRLIQKKPINIELLIEDFFRWSPKKEKEFLEQEIEERYEWMKKVNLVPRGFGKVV